MTRDSPIAVFAMHVGQDSLARTVVYVTKLLTVTVALIAIGILLGICIRAILKALWSGTEYGTWPGLKKWIGRKSTQSPMEVLLKESKQILEDMVAVSGVSPFSKGQIGTFEGIPIVYDKNISPGKAYLMNPKMIIWDDQEIHLKAYNQYNKSMAPPSDWFSEMNTNLTTTKVGICGTYSQMHDAICFADKSECKEGVKHKPVSCALIHNILKNVNDDEHLERMIDLKNAVAEGHFILEVPDPNEQPLEQPHPKLCKGPTGGRTSKQKIITAVLREYLEPIHMEGGETWLEVKTPEFTYDVLAARILQRLENGD